MPLSNNNNDYQSILRELISKEAELPWLEFKHNNTNPQAIGEYISALSNSAALHSQPYGYLVWGIDDKTRTPVGTEFKPSETRSGNEELENWLLHLLDPQIHFRFISLDYSNLPIVLLEIPSATSQPIRFSGKEWIRIGSYKKPLKDHPRHERDLWMGFERTSFEDQVAKRNLIGSEVIGVLDYQLYFRLLGSPTPKTQKAILERLSIEGIINLNPNGKYDVTNLGAILFANNLPDFPSLAPKAIRLIRYYGKDKTQTIREVRGTRGYAIGFENLIKRTLSESPKKEVIDFAIRNQVSYYPTLVIREIIANAIIHQDFLMTGVGPMIEIFSDRIEITSPGIPMIPPDRFLDSPPQSRNPKISNLMFRMNICEQRGSGIDKVISETEAFHLPSPRFEVRNHFTRVVLLEPKPYSRLSPTERINACYLHSSLRYENNNPMTSESLRERFALGKEDYYLISGVIQDSLAAGVIKYEPLKDDSILLRYFPYWA